MTWRDKLEIGLKENAQYRKDNLPLNEVIGPELPQGPGRSAEIPRARDAEQPPSEDAGSAETAQRADVPPSSSAPAIPCEGE